ncbi:AAA family ATPase [Streptomyces sp. NPDC092295]|uniref:AAA family ATPase n=1 Tax=Streptomyces sp. NPDC092295 TaxID=3366011 RepID=UPI003819388A
MPGLPDPPLPGRSAELATLRSAVHAAGRGVSRVVLVSGPAGAGKTVLVDHLARTVRDAFTVLRVAPSPPPRPFALTGQVLAAGASGPTGRPFGDRTRSTLAAGAELASLLGRLQDERPVLLWIDDAHAADLESLRALGFALLRQYTERVLTVICTRDAERTVWDTGLAFLAPEVERVELAERPTSALRAPGAYGCPAPHARQGERPPAGAQERPAPGRGRLAGPRTEFSADPRTEPGAGPRAEPRAEPGAEPRTEPSAEPREPCSVAGEIRRLVADGRGREALRLFGQALLLPYGPDRDEALGLLSLAEARDERARVYLRRAREGFEAAGELHRAGDVACDVGVVESALGLAREAVDSSLFAMRHAGDEAKRARALANLAHGHALDGGPAKGLRHLDELPRTPASAPAAYTDLLIQRGMLRSLAGDLTGALTDLDAAARRRMSGAPRMGTVSALAHSVWCHFFLGDRQRAFRTLAVAHDTARTMGRPADAFALHCAGAALHAFGGRFGDARAEFAAAHGLGSWADSSSPQLFLAVAEALVEFPAGDHARVVELLDGANAPARDVRSRLYASRYVPLLGVSHVRLGDLAGARSALRVLESFEELGALLPVSVLWLRGAMAARSGDTQGAVGAYRAALAVPPDGGEPVLHKALVEQDLGALHLATGDTVRARRHLRAAERRFAGMGAEPFRERCRSLLSEAPQPACPRETVREIWGTLSERERNIAGLVARGWTNREIAAEQYLSVKTVEYHLANVYAKLGVADRRRLRDLVQSHIHGWS